MVQEVENLRKEVDKLKHSGETDLITVCDVNVRHNHLYLLPVVTFWSAGEVLKVVGGFSGVVCRSDNTYFHIKVKLEP